MASENAGSTSVIADIGSLVRTALLENGDIDGEGIERVIEYLLGGQKVTPEGLLSLLELEDQDADADS